MLVAVCATTGIVFGFSFVKERWTSGDVDINMWQTYTSQVFGFRVSIPPDWIVIEFPNDEIAPRVNMYPSRQKQLLASSTQENIEHILPLAPNSPIFNVSIFPHGIPTEEFWGESVPSDISFGEKTKDARDFLLKDGSRFATVASFENVPTSWNASGFISAYALKKKTRTGCVRNGRRVAIETCDSLLGDTIVRSARMSVRNREIQKIILSSFMFTES